MSIPKPEVQQPMVEIERLLSLPREFLVSLYEKEDDWSFVIKTHAFLEAALTHLLTEHLGNAELLPIFAYLETSNIRTGKLAFVKAFDLLNKGGRRFIHTLSELRNDLVHEVANVTFTFSDYVAHMSEKERQEFIGAFDYALVAMASAQNQPVDAGTRATIDAIVTTAPRLAIVGGAALIAVDIYFKNRDAEVPRQAFAQLRGRIFEEWQRIQVTGDGTE